jgi:hypothetical protein
MFFFYSLACIFECVEFYEGGPRVGRPPMIAESFRYTAIQSNDATSFRGISPTDDDHVDVVRLLL